MSSSGRDDVHEKKPTAATTTDKYAGMLLAHPTVREGNRSGRDAMF